MLAMILLMLKFRHYKEKNVYSPSLKGEEMGTLTTINIETVNEGFVNIMDQVKSSLDELISSDVSGILHLFLPHTSCGLAIQEAFDSSAKSDMEKFLQHLAPRNLSFIEHTAEGEDDSPSHMKALVTNHSLQIIVESGKMLLGTWQGIYLLEFRDGKHQRKLHLKFLKG